MDTKIWNNILEEYKDGASQSSLSKKYGVSTYLIRNYLVSNGVQIRNQKEQTAISNTYRSLKVNDMYFDTITTPRQAWLLGFLAADGNVAADCNRIKITLSEIDSEVLEKIKDEIQTEHQVLHLTTNNGFNVAQFHWSSKKHKEDLAKYGIVPRKTYKKMEIPNFDNKDLMLSYFLGYYDGDGCFKNDGTTCRIEICSYRPEILESFSVFLSDYFNIAPKTVYKDPSRNSYHTLTYSTKQAVQILDRCYTQNDLFLTRKMLKYVEWKKQNCRI